MDVFVRQTRALLRRYLLSAVRSSPIAALLRLLLWPLLLSLLFLLLCIKTQASADEKQVWFSLEPASMMPLLALGLVVFNAYHFVDCLVHDKSCGLKSLMLAMGLRRAAFYATHLCAMLATLLPWFWLNAITASFFVQPNCSPLKLLLVFGAFAFQQSSCFFAFSSLLSSTHYSALVVAALLLEIQLHPLVVWLVELAPNLKVLTLFVASLSPLEALRIFCESFKEQPQNIVFQPTEITLVAMLFWALASLAFSRWFDEICPWQTESAAKSPLFCLKSSSSSSNEDSNEQDLNDDSNYFERIEHANKQIGIKLSKLSKSFKSVKVVDCVTFNIYRGETTLLLGHNGAGKTTTMNMILGKLLPDEGRVCISSSNASSVGVCPQSSVLDDNLNVRQHLELFADLKSSASSKVERENHIRQTIEDVSLIGQEQKLPSELSGGMRRKLSLALAFVGKSSILILDEPSSGLDPDSRLFIWNAIRRHREERTVLLSTQHMEEADYLGDRIAIMSAGKLVCCGSSSFLNETFGTGYKLRVECAQEQRGRLLEFVQKFFGNAQAADEHSQLGSSEEPRDFLIELGAQAKANGQECELALINLLEALKAQAEQLGALSFGLKSSSMEDVMLEVGKTFERREQVRIQLAARGALEHQLLVNPPLNFTEANFLGVQLDLLAALVQSHLQSFRWDLANALTFRLGLVLVASYAMVINLQLLLLTRSFGAWMATTPLLMVMYLVQLPAVERLSKLKIIKLCSKLNVLTYWLGHLFVDLLSVLVQVFSMNAMLLFALKVDFVAPLGSLLLLNSCAFLLFGTSSAALAYIASLLAGSAKSAMRYLILPLSLALIICALVQLAAAFVAKLSWLQLAVDLLYVSTCPTGALIYVLYGFAAECYLKPISEERCEPVGVPISPVVLGLAALLAQTLVYFYLLHAVEVNQLDLRALLWDQKRCLSSEAARKRSAQLDADVLSEQLKVEEALRCASEAEKLAMLAEKLAKSYTKSRRAVDELSFALKRGECFGLLGVNGAGKSSAFSLLTAETQPDEGAVWLPAQNGNSFAPLNAKRRAQLGYAPQLLGDVLLSARQALTLMAQLRRVQSSALAELVSQTLEALDMSEHANKLARDLSGGTKRKLALGMSLIGRPSLLALDEPTAGVDPVARRSIWQLLRSLRLQGGASIVISSHAMEECEAICDRISIMARGRLRCIGTFLHLRAKFAQGCTIKVNFGPQNLNQPKALLEQSETTERLHRQLIEAAGAQVELADSSFSSAIFRVPNETSRAKLFKVMREFREANLNASYTINDATLEDVFVALAN